MQPKTEWLFKKAQISHLELSLLEVHKFLSLRFEVQWLTSVGVQGCGLGFSGLGIGCRGWGMGFGVSD